MAPRKSIVKTSAPSQNTEAKPKKPRKERIKKQKPILKIPDVIKVKITRTPRISQSISSKPKLSKAENAALRKIEMANEVALAALSKSPVIVETDIVKTEPGTETNETNDVTNFERGSDAVGKPKKGKKRGRQKKTQSAVDTPEVTEVNSDVAVTQPKKKIKLNRGKLVKQAPDNNDNLNVPENCEKVAPPKKKGKTKPVKTTKKVVANGVPSKKKTESTTKQPNISEPKNKKKKTTEIAQCKHITGIKRKYTKKGKNADDMSASEHHNSPSILDPMPLKYKNSASEHRNSPSILDHMPMKYKNLDSSALKPPGTIDSRKTSMTSVSECLSWTKDISSSSTTTSCQSVSTKDIVRFDKKLPVLRLADVSRDLKPSAHPADVPPVKDLVEETTSHAETTEPEVKDTMPSSSSSSCSSSSSSSSSDHSHRSLDLSSSSPIKSLSTVDTHDYENFKYTSEKVQSLIKKLDLEIITWIGFNNENTDPNVTKLVDKGLKMLKEESDILKICKDLNSILSEEHNEYPLDKESTVVNEIANKEIDLERPDSCPGNVSDKSEEDHNFLTTNSKYVMLDQNYENGEGAVLKKNNGQIVSSGHSSQETFTSDRVKYTSFDATYNDDDDALSLYAESISGMESSKLVSSAPSLCASEPDFEEYVPQRITNVPIPEFSYNPSRIEVEPELDDQNEAATNYLKYRAGCEKQNIDSTSLYKEPETSDMSTIVANNEFETPESNEVVTLPKNIPSPALTVNTQRKRLIAALYQPMNAVRSSIFRGVCFFNLISNCKKARCTFPHVKLDISEIKNRLTKLSEEYFIQEYMLMRNFPILRQFYGTLFVKECQRRELTRILVEMSIDFIMKAKVNSVDDKEQKIFVIEQALMHLNNVDLRVCDDLLLHNVGQDEFLCDVYMETLAKTLNFSRFKQIFTKLAEFVVKHGKSFDSGIVTKILERVCILPYEEQIAKTMALMIKNTDENIFDAMTQFDRHLLTNGAQELYDDITAYRKRMLLNRSSVTNVYKSPSSHVSQDMEMSLNQADSERYTSPDTANLDNLNKTNEPIIKRTINFNRLMFNQSNESEEYKRAPKPRFKHWRPQNTHKFMNSPPRFPRPPLIKRPMPMMNRLLDERMFGPTQPKFPRRPGPGMDHY